MGKVIFVGAGPGVADLITVRGAKALATADVVLADALADPALREQAPQAEWIDVGKRGFEHSTGQSRINALLVEHGSRSCCTVVRLKGGDPSVFGRLEEELLALEAAHIPCEVIPGITAASAAAAATRRPLTRRGSGRSVALSTAMTAEKELRADRRADTEVFYMAGKQLGSLSLRLQESGWASDEPVMVVSRAGCADQKMTYHSVTTLHEASPHHAGRPAVVVVGVGATPASRLPAASTACEHATP
jgi:uroporphyrin-III C-methyltransferase